MKFRIKSCLYFQAKKRLVPSTFLSIINYGHIVYMYSSAQSLHSLATVYNTARRFIWSPTVTTLFSIPSHLSLLVISLTRIASSYKLWQGFFHNNYSQTLNWGKRPLSSLPLQIGIYFRVSQMLQEAGLFEDKNHLWKTWSKVVVTVDVSCFSVII